MTPKVSIITTTYNDADNLRKSIDGIYHQDYQEIEYIIVDGASTDDTLSVIKEAEARFQGRLKWISEKDNGIYDAINKGIAMAEGDIVGFMFDSFAGTDTVSKMVEAITRDGADGVHGDINYVDGDKIVRKWRMGTGTIHQGWMPGHPTLYLKREIYEKYGNYKTDYKIAADYEFMVRILKDNQVKLTYIPEVLVNMFYGGTSTGGLSNYINSFRESYRALKENKVSFPLWICVRRTIRVLLQFE